MDLVFSKNVIVYLLFMPYGRSKFVFLELMLFICIESVYQIDSDLNGMV